jgi:hypothetical protein
LRRLKYVKFIHAEGFRYSSRWRFPCLWYFSHFKKLKLKLTFFTLYFISIADSNAVINWYLSRNRHRSRPARCLSASRLLGTSSSGAANSLRGTCEPEPLN